MPQMHVRTFTGFWIGVFSASKILAKGVGNGHVMSCSHIYTSHRDSDLFFHRDTGADLVEPSAKGEKLHCFVPGRTTSATKRNMGLKAIKRPEASATKKMLQRIT